jgi:hypothetical protein
MIDLKDFNFLGWQMVQSVLENKLLVMMKEMRHNIAGLMK